MGAAVVPPHVNGDAVSLHRAGISRSVAHGAHAVLVPGQAGWRTSRKPQVPQNTHLPPLPPCAPELNPAESVRAWLRASFLGHCVWNSDNAVVDACCDA